MGLLLLIDWEQAQCLIIGAYAILAKNPTAKKTFSNMNIYLKYKDPYTLFGPLPAYTYRNLHWDAK